MWQLWNETLGLEIAVREKGCADRNPWKGSKEEKDRRKGNQKPEENNRFYI